MTHPCTPLFALLLVACPGPPLDESGLEESGMGWPPFDTHDTGDGAPPDWAIVHGTVAVQLRTWDEDGDLALLPWEESCFGETWPYGPILVAAWVEAEDGAPRWLDTFLIPSPAMDPASNTYELTIENAGAWEVHVAAFLDKWQDRVIGSADPVAPATGLVRLVGEGEQPEDVDVVIDTPYWCGNADSGACPDCPPAWGGGLCWIWDGGAWIQDGCSFDCASFVTISGDLWSVVPDVSLTGSAHGAEGFFDFQACANLGTFGLRGVGDRNGNDLWDFDDLWGQPVDDDGNPLPDLAIGEEDLAGLRVVVPVAGAAPAVTPEVRVDGRVGLAGGFDTLLAERPQAALHVIALRAGFALEERELCPEDLGEARAHAHWEAGTLVGQESLPFDLILAGHAPVHLGAWVDLDGNGVLGEIGEPAAWWDGGGVHGLLDAGDAGLSGIELQL